MGRVITIASGKGGVGKTTLTANLGIAIAQKGFKVCLVDADVAMANLSLLLGMQASPITLHDVLLGQSSVYDAVYDTPSGVKFIPSGLSLDTYRKVDPARLTSVIESISGDYDYVLIDAAAGIERTVLAAISAAEEILLITTPDTPSIADVLKMKITTQRLGARPIGVVVNFVRNEKQEITENDIMKMLELSVYGMIPYDDAVRKAFQEGKGNPTIMKSPKSPASVAIKKIADKLTGRVVEFKETEEKEKKQGGFGKLLKKFSGIFRRKKKPKPELR